MRLLSRWVLAGVLAVGVGACGDDDDSPSSASGNCEASEGAGNVISSFEIDVEGDRAIVTYALAKSGSVGLVFTKPADKPTPKKFVGRVPFGPQRVIDQPIVREITAEELKDVPPGQYAAHLRAFPEDQLNVGEPLDISTRCVKFS